MISRNQIESILKLNGVEPQSPDDVIRSVLMSARYDENEINTALMVLRKNTKTNKTRIDGLHKVFRTDESLRPQEISLLLGVELEMTEEIKPGAHLRKFSTGNYLAIIILSIALALLSAIFLMYIQDAGPFHHSMVN